MVAVIESSFPLILVISSGMLTIAGIFDIVKNGPRNPEKLKTDTLTPSVNS